VHFQTLAIQQIALHAHEKIAPCSLSFSFRVIESTLWVIRLCPYFFLATPKDPCPDGFIKYKNNTCYYLAKQSKSWQNAVADCKSKSSDLLYISSIYEQGKGVDTNTL